MFKSGWILITALTLAPVAGRASSFPFRDWLTVPPACAEWLEPQSLAGAIAADLDVPDAARAYTDASFVQMQSPFAQAIFSPLTSVDPSILAMNARGLRLALSRDGGQLILSERDVEIHRWTMTEPIAEVRFRADAGGGDFALVGWVTHRHYRLADGRLTEVERPPAALAPHDRDGEPHDDVIRRVHTRVSPWIPARAGRDATEDVARLAVLTPRPVARLNEALGELVTHVLDRARQICDRTAPAGGVSSQTYPNQLLAVAAQALRDRSTLREILVMTTNERARGAFGLRLPKRVSDPHHPDVLEIHLPNCAPVILSIPDDPYAEPAGWAALRERI